MRFIVVRKPACPLFLSLRGSFIKSIDSSGSQPNLTNGQVAF